MNDIHLKIITIFFPHGNTWEHSKLVASTPGLPGPLQHCHLSACRGRHPSDSNLLSTNPLNPYVCYLRFAIYHHYTPVLLADLYIPYMDPIN